MNDFAFIYLAQRFVYRAGDFFRHWYVDGTRFFLSTALAYFRNFETTMALRVTLQHFFEPLYKDYSIVGILLGPVFRSGRVLLGTGAYVILGLLATCAYLLWLIIPIAIVIYAFS